MDTFNVYENGNIADVTQLLNGGANINSLSLFGMTPLMYACRGRNLEVVKLLLSRGADVNARATDGRTALIIASMTRNVEIVQFLLTKGADINARTTQGMTAYSVGTPQIQEILEKWPTTMGIVLFDELALHQTDAQDLIDLNQFAGPPSGGRKRKTNKKRKNKRRKTNKRRKNKK